MDTPRPVFILSPPRSLSTVTAAMFGMHPELFAFPELNLFAAPTLGEIAGLTGKASPPNFLGGLWRALAYVHEGVQSEEALQRARDWVAQRLDWTGARMLAYLADAVRPRRAVDKSPAAALIPGTLERLVEAFPDSKLLHLVRSPGPSIASLAKLFRDYEGAADRHTRAATAWLYAHTEIARLGSAVGFRRYRRVQGEALLERSAAELPPILDWLRVSRSPGALARMLRTEAWPFARTASAAPFGGDPDFFASPGRRSAPCGRTAEEEVFDFVEPGVRDAVADLVRRLGCELGDSAGEEPCPTNSRRSASG